MGFWSGKTCLVTGADGFIGSALCRRLESEGAIVHGIDIALRVYTASKQYDVCDYNDLRSLFVEIHPEIVFHLAAKTEVIDSYRIPVSTYNTNATGTMHILECCRQFAVKSVCIASTDKVYGSWSRASLPYVETAPLTAPCPDPYSMSKRIADLMAQHYAQAFGLPVRILRSANTFGPGQRNETTLITSTVLKLMRGEKPVIHAGMEDVLREWLYIDDAVEAYLLLAEDAWRMPEFRQNHIVYNVGSSVCRSPRDVIRDICDILGVRTVVFTACPAVAQLGNQWLDSTKMNERFPGWRQAGFRESLIHTIGWYREQYEQAHNTL